ncbi:MAG: PQQ-dependent sugar dehydrogenase, partial [Thermocrispum sp.]
MPRLRTPAALLAVTALAITGCSDPAAGYAPPKGAIDGQKRSHSSSKLKVTEVADGMKVGWDIGFLPSGNVLIPQRSGKLSVVSSKTNGEEVTDIANLKDAKVTDVKIDLPEPYVKAEGGLLGMVLHPDFKSSRKFTLCQTTQTKDEKPKDIRLITWK